MSDPKDAEKVAHWLKAIADPTRVAILWTLARGPQSVGELSKLLGVLMVNMSHHLQVLRQAGLVADARKGRFVIYTLTGGLVAHFGSLLLRHGPSQVIVELRPDKAAETPPAAA